MQLLSAMRRGLAIALTLVTLIPGMAVARPALTTDLDSQDGFIAMTGPLGGTPVHRHLDVAFINLDNTLGALRYGVTFQYGSAFAVDPNDYIGHETDHRSLRIEREVYIGATASLRVHGAWRLIAGSGAIQTRLHNGFDDAIHPWQGSQTTLTGWRMAVGAQHPLGPTLLTLGWQMTRYPDQRQDDPSQPTSGSSSRIALDITTPL